MRNFWVEHSVMKAIVMIILGIAIIFLQAWAVMFLWNWIVVGLFNAPILNYWLAFGLRLLCSLLFKGRTIVKKSNED